MYLNLFRIVNNITPPNARKQKYVKIDKAVEEAEDDLMKDYDVDFFLGRLSNLYKGTKKKKKVHVRNIIKKIS